MDLVSPSLHSEVNHLRFDNKELAQQLHVSRYTSKSDIQQKVDDLRAVTLQAQNENVAIKSVIATRLKNIHQCHGVVQDQQKRLDGEKKNMNELLQNIADREHVISMLKHRKSDKLKNLNQANAWLSESRKELEEVTTLCNEEIKVKSLMEKSTYKIHKDIAILRAIEESKLKGMNSLSNLTQHINMEIRMINDEAKMIIEQTNCINTNIGNMENLNKLSEENALFIKEKNALISAKLSALLKILQHQLSLSQMIQTDSITNKSSTLCVGMTHDQENNRGKIIRVAGLGGNAKFNLGKDLEVRATSYSRHVNFNLKFKK